MELDLTWNSFMKELASELGEAVWAFARIEKISFEYLRQLSTDTLDVLMQGVLLSGRLTVIKHLVDRADFGDPEMQKLAMKSIEKIEKLQGTRNLIVHNPWNIWVDFDAKGFVAEIERVPEAKKTLARDQLEEFTRRCYDVVGDLEEALAHYIGRNQ